jgi:hypothetical protein
MMAYWLLGTIQLPVFRLADSYLGPCTLPKHQFFFLPSWWEFVPTKIDAITNQCVVAFKFPGDIWAVGLAILDMLLRIGGFAAVISIIVAGLQYIMATGNPEKGSSARKRLTNSLIGLAIVLIAAGVVSYIGNAIGG